MCAVTIQMDNSDLITLAHLISVGIITPDEYIAWCDAKILSENDPPMFVLDLSLIRNPALASERLLKEAYENFGQEYYTFDTGYFQVCSYFLAYEAGHLTWDDFLHKAIEITKEKPSGWPLGDYEKYLTAYIENGKDQSMELAQSKYTREAFIEEIEQLEKYVEMFKVQNL